MTTTATVPAPTTKVTAPDPGYVWAYGIHEPGWYVARWNWNDAYAKHLESIGYRVMRSVKMPDEP